MVIGFEPVRLSGDTLLVMDQRMLPNRVRTLRLRTSEGVWRAIREMAVRGAPAIGIAGAYGMYVGLLEGKAKTRAQAMKRLRAVGRFLKTARPTAVNLAWAIDRVIRKARESRQGDVPSLVAFVRGEAESIHHQDQDLCQAIGRSGEVLIRSGDGILVHCNAGGLATSGYGTALAILYTAHGAGKKLRVFVTETRPLLQGSRLTMWELTQAGIPATLVCDSAAGMLMRTEKIKAVMVGADRIARNGDTANKIGTYSLALLARHHGIPFYVAAPSSTFDFSIPDGVHIPIEERPAGEIVASFGCRTAPKGVRVYNPAFDITPHPWITSFITERGVLKPPFSRSLRCLREEAFGPLVSSD